MTFRSSPCRTLACVAATLFTLGLGSAQAQPSGPGPMAPPMGHGFALEQAIEALKGKLSLNTMQQTLWDNAAAQGKAGRESGRAQMQKVKDAMRAELAKPEPNLAAVAAVADDAEAQGRALRHQARDGWLNVYATFTPAQKGIVRDALQQKMDMVGGFRERMQKRLGG